MSTPTKEPTMIDQETQNETTASARRWGTAAALMAAGLAGGVIIAGTVSANAADGTPSPSTSASSGATAGEGAAGQGGAPVDPSQSQRSDETLLTGDKAEKVTAAALAKYPGATVERVETDSDGVYEAHLVTADGTHVIVAVGEDFTVTGTQEMGAGGPGGHGGPGGKGGGNGETPLTGNTADKVEAAALAKYPGATVERLETDSEGVYEAHLVTADGTHVIVAVGEDFTVTGTQEMTGGPQGPKGGPDGTQPSAAPSASSTA
jgi:uncharacterized membrane protein YkoI